VVTLEEEENAPVLPAMALQQSTPEVRGALMEGKQTAFSLCARTLNFANQLVGTCGLLSGGLSMRLLALVEVVSGRTTVPAK
jgi:hypothetical protein